MSSNCVHGFISQHCWQCRTCPHGLTTSRCGRCASLTTSRAAAKMVPPAQPPEEHRGFEVFFVPQERSWYFRESPDAPPQGTSYRSAFQAKLAINASLDAAPLPEPARKRR